MITKLTVTLVAHHDGIAVALGTQHPQLLVLEDARDREDSRPDHVTDEPTVVLSIRPLTSPDTARILPATVPDRRVAPTVIRRIPTRDTDIDMSVS